MYFYSIGGCWVPMSVISTNLNLHFNHCSGIGCEGEERWYLEIFIKKHTSLKSAVPLGYLQIPAR